MNINTENLDKNCEHWASIDGYVNYEVSWFGRVRNATTGRILKNTRAFRRWFIKQQKIKHIPSTSSSHTSGWAIQKKRDVSTIAMATAQTITSKTSDRRLTRKTIETEARGQTHLQFIMVSAGAREQINGQLKFKLMESEHV